MASSLDPNLLAKWSDEQRQISSEVVVLSDPDDEDDSSSSSLPPVSRLSDYRYLRKAGHQQRLYGGLDVSFPKEGEGDDMPTVAVYVVLRGDEVVYQDHLHFHLTVPYVSSYLAFREIEPYVSAYLDRRTRIL